MNKKKKNSPTVDSLTGDKTYLKPPSADDVLNFHHWLIQSDPHARSCRPVIMKSSTEVIEAFKKREPSDDRQEFAICSLDDKTLLGKISYFSYNSLNRSAELGILIDPDHRQHGYASDAAQTLISYLFKFWGLNKVYAQTAAFNTSAVKLMESLGFKREATLRDHYFYNGEFSTGYIYSLLLYELDW